MPKMIISIDGVVIKEVQLTKDRTTLGRRPYNDVVIDNLAVSGEHAALEMADGAVFLEDLDSTNGTYVNGKAIRRQQLQHGDAIEIGKYKIKYVSEAAAAGPEPGAASAAPVAGEAAPAAASVGGAAGADPSHAAAPAVIKVLSGAAAGRQVALAKVVTTIGKPGVAVAAITRRAQGYAISHVDGEGKPLLNGAAIGDEPVALKDGDILDLAGTQMQFSQG